MHAHPCHPARCSRSLLVGLAALLGVAFASAPHVARACGGCFAPSGEASPVIAHRMAVLMAADRTVLWDQFEYEGDPSEFVWILPVLGTEEVEVELSTGDFFQQLSAMTRVQLSGPFQSTGGGGRSPFFGCGGSADGGSYSRVEPPVTVYREATVGPYETVVIGSEDPDALVTWLRDHDYVIGDDLLPIIDYYTRRGSNFLALRISPDAYQKRMQPVRVTCPVASDTLPLRMVTAGVRSSVALELFVFGDVRYQAANFVNVEVDREEVTFSRTTSTYNYDALAAQALTQRAGEVWLTEFADQLDYWEYDPAEPDGQGGVYSAPDDWAVVRNVYSTPFLTRMRADLPVHALAGDLALEPSLLPSLPRTIQVTRFDDTPAEATAASGLPPVPALIVLGAGLLGVLRRRR